MRIGWLFPLVVLMSGCSPMYASRKEVPKELLDILWESDNYYLKKASQEAAFLLNCEEDKLRSEVLTTTRRRFRLQIRGTAEGASVTDERPEVIAVAGCDKRATYHLFCDEYGYEYAAPATANAESGFRPCKVLPTGRSSNEKTPAAIGRANKR